jgi:hypothetical protein
VQRHYVGKLYKLMEKLYLWSAAWTTWKMYWFNTDLIVSHSNKLL